MSKMATKAADNVFYKARMVAAKWNDKLSSREGASEVTGLDRTRIAYIELGTIKYDLYFDALTLNPEADYMREKMDTAIKRICGDTGDFFPFEQRYDWLA